MSETNTSQVMGQWESVKKNFAESILKMFPIQGRKNVLEMQEITFDESKAHPSDIRAQELAKHQEKTWGIPVYAKFVLKDKLTGQTINESKQKLAVMPRLTPRDTYIVSGGEWNSAYQWRLKSGIYSKVKENGQLETEFNLNGAGKDFAREARLKIPFDPEKKSFKLKYGTISIPLYSMLKADDMSDEDIKKEWGEDIFNANYKKNWQQDITKLYNSKLKKRGVVAESDTFDHIKIAVQKELHKAEVLPETTKLTLGKEVQNLSGKALLDGSMHILGVSQGKKPDDVYSVYFKHLLGLDDFIAEKFGGSKTAQAIKAKIRNTIDKREKVAQIIPNDLFSKPLSQVFIGNTLSQRPDQTNPIDILSSSSITTIKGPGGISSDHSIRNPMKVISQSHFAILDPILSPECFKEGAELLTWEGYKKVEEITYEDKLACLINGKLEYHKPEKVHVYDYEGEMYGVNGDRAKYLVTPNHRILCRPGWGSIYKVEEADKVAGKYVVVKNTHEAFECDEVKSFKLDLIERHPMNFVGHIIDEEIDIVLWAEFMGWWLSEGSISAKDGAHAITITQMVHVNPDKVQKIKDLLKKLPWNFQYDGRKTFRLTNKQLGTYLKQFGKCDEKFIPEYFFRAKKEAREKLLESLLLGDGRLCKKNKKYEQAIYTTTSAQLALDVERLIISLGHGTTHKVYQDNRQERYLDVHEVRVLRRPELHIYKDMHYKEFHKGKVYCVTVPGSFVYAKYKDGAGLWIGNSAETGVTLHLPTGSKKVGREARTLAYDLLHKKFDYINASQLHGDYTVLPDQIKWKGGNPSAIGKATNEDLSTYQLGTPSAKSSLVTALDPKTHEFVEIPFEKARYVLPSPRNLFSEATNLIPFLQNNQGNRTMTGAKQPSQGVPLKYREAPLIQVQSNDPNTSFEEFFGRRFSHQTPVNGTITDIVKDKLGNTDEVHIEDTTGKTHKVQLYNNFPLNDKKSFLHAEPVVKIGDKVTKGQQIADSNFSKSGVLACGINLKTAYMPYGALTFEDGVVISESGAKKLTSEHLHKTALELDPKNDKVSLSKFISHISTVGKKIKKDKLANLDENGIIKPGSIVRPGDLLVTAISKNTLEGQLGSMTSKLKGAYSAYKDKSLVWDHDYEGHVIKVVPKPGEKGYTVYVKTQEPAKVGDKICYDEETEILTKDGWKFVKDVTLEDYVWTLTKDHTVEFHQPYQLHKYPTGDDMYKIAAQEMDLFVTLDHNMYVRQEGKDNFEIITAREILDKSVTYLVGNENPTFNDLKEVLIGPQKVTVVKNYKKPVYCLTVENHIVYVRRNGSKGVVSGQCGRAGDKNIIGAIIPDHQMPRIVGETTPIDLLTAPSSVVSRINIGQLLEMGASKIAKKTGKPYVVTNFAPGVDYAEKLRQEMKEHGVSDTDKIFDPLLNKELEGAVLTGHKYIIKQKHQVEKKESVRGLDQALAGKYSVNFDPQRGKGEGAQAISPLDFYALLAHGARANLKEMSSYKAELQHDSNTGMLTDSDFWNRVMLGIPLQPPKPTFAYRKFEGYLTGLGLNLKKDGHSTVLTPLTDKGVLELSNGEIKEADQTRGKDDKEIPGGLFDPRILGGLPNQPGKGRNWGHVSLAEPFPNPIFVGSVHLPGPAPVLSGLSFANFDKVVKGQMTTLVNGKEMTGGKAIAELLKKIDVKKDFEKIKAQLPTLKGSELNKANKKAKFLQALDRLNLRPEEAYIMNHVPILPPMFRPITVLPDGSSTSADINTLYKNLILLNNGLKEKDMLKNFPEKEQKLREDVYDALKATTGLGKVPSYDGNKALKGILQTVAGDSPKTGFFQSKIMKRRQELSMRSTIIPDPNMSIDEVGLPKSAAFELYKPFILRELIRSGKDILEANKEVKEGTAIAWKALDNAIKDRPVLMKRDPVLHKYNVMAYRPKLIEGNAIGVHPLNCSLGNSDFDGDQNLHLIFVYIEDKTRDDVYMKFRPQNGNKADDDKVSFTVKEFWDERKVDMAARFNTFLPTGLQDGNFYVLHLEDFPRTDFIGSKDGVDFYNVPNGTYVISYDQYSLQPVLAEVTNYSIHHDRKVSIINLSSGKQIVADDDPRAVYGFDTKMKLFGRWRPEDAIGKLVPVVKNINFPVTRTSIEVDCDHPTVYKTVELNEATGYTLGALVGDGWADRKATLLSNNSRNVSDKYLAGLKHFMKDPYLYEHEAIHQPFGLGKDVLHRRFALSRKGFQDVIGAWIGRGAENKHLPPFTFTAPKEFRLGVLAGLIDTDGSMSISHGKAKPQFLCNYTTKSIRLAMELVLLCKTLEIQASITDTKTPKGEDFWCINISSIGLYNNQDLGIVHEDRQPAWNFLKQTFDPGLAKVSISLDRIPINEDQIKVFSKVRKYGEDALYVSVKQSKVRGYITRAAAKRCLNILWDKVTEEERNTIRLVAEMTSKEDINWEPVVSFRHTDIVTTGYDITVPGTETFMSSDGIILSNTHAIHLPLTEQARQEAIDKMLPSKNLFSATNYGIMHAPDQESIIGLNNLSLWGAKKERNYKSLDDLVKSESHLNDVVNVKIDGQVKETTKGRALLVQSAPQDMDHDKLLHDPSFLLKKSSIHKMLETFAKKDPKGYPILVDDWRRKGNDRAHEMGFSFNLSDLKPFKEKRDAILAPYHQKAAQIRKSKDGIEEQDNKIVTLYNEATEHLDKELAKDYAAANNNMYKMVDTKARGSMAQFRQTVIAPMLLVDANNRVIPTPVTNSYSEGLNVAQYWTTLHGARKGTLNRAQSTSVPGSMAKELVNLNIATPITKHDCGTNHGLSMSLHDKNGHEEKDVMDRYLAKDQHGLTKGTLVTPEIFAKLNKEGIKKIEIRSPITCEVPQGICSSCFGLSENGRAHEIGTNIGVIASQALSEPAVQLSMDSITPDSILTISRNNKVETLTIKDLYDSMPEQELSIGPVLTKFTEDLLVKDIDKEGNTKFVKVFTIQKYPLDSFAVKVATKFASLECKESHPFWARKEKNSEWEVVKAKDLEGWFVYTEEKENTLEKVVSVEKTDYQGLVYDISTETQSYLTCGMKTHNSFHCFSKDSIIFVNNKNKQLVTTMEEVFNMVEGEILEDREKQYKAVVSGEWKIWDGEWVDLLQVTRHKPTEPIMFLGDSHLAVISQETHRVATHKNLSRCIYCNNPSVKQRRSKRTNVIGKVVCCVCRKEQKGTPNLFAPEMELTIAKDVKVGEFNSFNIEPILTAQKIEDPKYDGYTIASFLAEGCVVYRKTFRRSKKVRETPKISFVDFSQIHKDVRENIYAHISKTTHCIMGKKNVSINNVKEAEWFASISPRYSSNKKLPPDFLGYSDEWLWSFLAGYLDTDGYLSKSRHDHFYLKYCGVSWAMMQQLLLIASKLNIHSSISSGGIPKPHKLGKQTITGKHPIFTVTLSASTKDLEKLKESVKVSKIDNPSPAINTVELKGNRKFTVVKAQEYVHEYVYDCTTSSGKMIVSGLLVSNSGGTAMSRGGGATSRLNRLQQLLNLPKTLPYSATLSKIDGKVHSISKTSTGGHEILIGREKDVHKHYVPSSLDLKVEVGQEIERGDPISSGPINPHQLLQLKDMSAVRKYLTTEMGDMYKDVGGVRRRNVEVVVRNLTNLTEVVDSGKSDHLAGDILPTSIVEAHNRMAKEKDDKILHRPILRGIKESALLKSEDYLSRMNFQRIQNTLIEGAGKMWRTTPRSLDPLSSWSNSSIDIQKDKNDAKY